MIEKLNTRTPCRTQLRILNNNKKERMLGSTARGLDIGTQLLHAEYVATSA